MLLNQFKTGVAASALLQGNSSSSRDALVKRGALHAGRVSRPVSVSVRATGAAEGAGWLESSSSGISSIGSKLSGFAGKVRKGSTAPVNGNDLVTYKGKVVIMKKLWRLDLIDRSADLADDASELLGKKVLFQLISDDIDSKTGKPILSKDVPIDNWVAVEGLAAQNITFNIQFSVLKDFGVPHGLLVRNRHPNEFLLVSFSVEISNVSEAL